MPVRYEQSPIQEAVLECFAEAVSWNAATADAVLREAGVPQDAELDIIKDNTLEVTQGQDVKHYQTARLRAWFEGRSHMYQVGPTLCAVNMLQPYTSFEKMAPMFERLARTFLEKSGAARVERLGQRYLNSIVVGKSQAVGLDNFRVAPALPAATPFQVAWLAHSDSTLRVQASLSVTEVTADSVRYMFDIYATSPSALAPKTDELMAWQAAAHQQLFRVFDGTLTERLQTQLGRIDGP